MGWDLFYGSPMSRERLEWRQFAAAEGLRSGGRQTDVARKYRMRIASMARWVED